MLDKIKTETCTLYRTTDGNEYFTLARAQNHQNELDQEAEKQLRNLTCEEGMERLSNFIHKHSELLKYNPDLNELMDAFWDDCDQFTFDYAVVDENNVLVEGRYQNPYDEFDNRYASSKMPKEWIDTQISDDDYKKSFTEHVKHYIQKQNESIDRNLYMVDKLREENEKISAEFEI